MLGLASVGRKEKSMRKQHIVVGKSYVNEDTGIIREVIEEVDSRHVRANTFELASGKLVPTRHNIWDRSQLAHWADRETTPPEAARIHPYERAAWFDVPLPPDRAGIPVEQALTSLEAMPGYHTGHLAR
jgi:hypothetical protein